VDESLVVVCSQRDLAFFQIQGLIAGNPEPITVLSILDPELVMNFLWSNVTPELFTISLINGVVRSYHIINGTVTVAAQAAVFTTASTI
jgi:hypothetical protein